MASTIVKIDARQIRDWNTFHDLFAQELGFPDFYGRNMDAWIDCLTSLDEPEDRMTSVHASKGGTLTLHLDHISDLANRCPEIYDAIVECSAFVNYRRMENGDAPILLLSFYRTEPKYRPVTT